MKAPRLHAGMMGVFYARRDQARRDQHRDRDGLVFVVTRVIEEPEEHYEIMFVGDNVVITAWPEELEIPLVPKPPADQPYSGVDDVRKRRLQEILALAQSAFDGKGLDLDEEVHEMKAQEAADINNGGLEAQVEYLAEAGGIDWLEEFVRTCEEDK